jgi:hypothetical protein
MISEVLYLKYLPVTITVRGQVSDLTTIAFSSSIVTYCYIHDKIPTAHME